MDLPQDEWLSKLKADGDAVILDVRTDEEWEDGIIPGARQIDIYKGQGFIDEVENLDKSKSYYIYCKAGGRSAQACQIMAQLGFPNTYNLIGGMMNWRGEVVAPGNSHG